MLVPGSRRVVFLSIPSLLLCRMEPALRPLEESVELIRQYTPGPFQQAVSKTRRCLYRGANFGVEGQGTIFAPSPDLLDWETYMDDDALAYFTCLEGSLTSGFARPSTGHIATSDATEAAKWGEVISVWPLGKSLSYAWPRKRPTFVPGSKSCSDDEIIVDTDLESALVLGREVLFATRPGLSSPFQSSVPNKEVSSAFLGIPSQYDRFVLDRLTM